MHELRARVFQDRMRWKVNVANGQEYDAYDTPETIYVLYIEDGLLKSCLRLLPLSGPTLVTDVFPDTLPMQRPVNAWEISRLCFANGLSPDDRAVIAVLLRNAIIEIAEHFHIEAVVATMTKMLMRWLKRLKFDFEIVGSRDSIYSAVWIL